MLTLKEKIAQMLICGIDGTELTGRTERLIKSAKVGGIILYSKNTPTAVETFELTNSLQVAAAETGVPLIIAIDEEHGRVSRIQEGSTRFVDMAAIGAMNDTSIVKEIAAITSRELTTLGINMNFAPVCDVNVNPDNEVIGDRSFSSDPDIVAKMVSAYISEGAKHNIMLCAKHFPGHGDTSIDSHLNLPKIVKPLRELDKCELIPFQAAINAGVPSIMTAHILFPELDSLPATMSRKIITELLIEKYWYSGVIISDDMCMGAIQKNYGTEEAFTRSINAGVNMFIISNMLEHAINIDALIETLEKLITDGAIEKKLIDESVDKIIKLKKRYIKYALRENSLREKSLRQASSLKFAERLRGLSGKSD